MWGCNIGGWEVWNIISVTCMTVVPTDCHMYVSGTNRLSHACQWYQQVVTCMSVVPIYCHMHVSGTNRLSHAFQWYQQAVTCMSVVPTDCHMHVSRTNRTELLFKNRCYIYQHVLRQVILWLLYFMGGNDVTPHSL